MVRLNSKKMLFLLGISAGLVAVVLSKFGNPKNMAICVACFIRDMAGAMRLHNAAVVQYFRPEIVGIILGAFIISFVNKEFKATSSNSLIIRFIGGVTMVIGALIFLGCSTRMILRMAAGDLSAYVGFIGLILGVSTGMFFLKRGYTLGVKNKINSKIGYFFPVLFLILFVISITTNIFASSVKGPGSMHAPVVISLICGILFGIIAQVTRMCFTGSVRNLIFFKNFEMITTIFSMFIIVLLYNIFTDNFQLVQYGSIAHSQNLWNILGLYIVGLSGTLLGGCPLRQVVLASQGSLDSVITVFGMFVGAAISHNFKLVSAVASKATENAPASLGGPNINGKIAVFLCILILLIIGFIGCKNGNQNETKNA